jgi:septum site-determining protein MinC
MAAPTDSLPAFELKDARLPLVVVALNTADLGVLGAELRAKLEETPNFFDDDPVVVDLSALAPDAPELDFPELVRLLSAHRMRPAMACGGSVEQMAGALAAGLPAAPEALPAPRPKMVEVEVIREVEVVREVPLYVPPLVVDRPLRSGQQVYAKGGDLIVLAAVNPGAEVIADGSIHVYAPLRGRAIAGSKGNADARIYTTCLEPELISIAGTYRTTETAIPPEVAGKPAQVRLVGDKLVMEPLKS